MANPKSVLSYGQLVELVMEVQDCDRLSANAFVGGFLYSLAKDSQIDRLTEYLEGQK